MITMLVNFCEKVYVGGNEALETVSKENDYCDVIVKDGYVYFVFAGSDDVQDWKENIFQPLQKSADQFIEDISRIIKINLSKSFVFCGHSRGGALAILCAEKASMISPCTVVTFGAPRVGNVAYKNNYDSLPINCINFRNGWDQITYLPLFSLGNRQPGTLVRLKKPQWWRLGFYRGKAHKIKEYVKSINKKYKND